MAIEAEHMELPMKARTERHEIEVDVAGKLVSLYASNPRDSEHDGAAVVMTPDMAIMVARALVRAANCIETPNKKARAIAGTGL